MKEESKNNQHSKENEIIEEHKKMLIMSGNISDFQLKNMKTWPFILFDGLETVAIDYDFSQVDTDEAQGTVGAGKVVYNLTTKEDVNEKEIETIRQWTRFLFWKDTQVEVKKVL